MLGAESGGASAGRVPILQMKVNLVLSLVISGLQMNLLATRWKEGCSRGCVYINQVVQCDM